MTKRNKRPWKIQPVLIALMVVICSVFIFLTEWELDLNQYKQLKAYEKVQQETGRMLMELAKSEYEETGLLDDANAMCESLVSVVCKGFVTSASNFCFVTMDERVVFLRDQRNQDEIVDLTREKLLMEYEKDYLIYEESTTVGDVKCSLGVITRKDYVAGQMGLSSLRVHIIVYMILTVLFAFALVTLMRSKVLRLSFGRNRLEEQLQVSRQAIDQLQRENDELKIVDPTEHRYGIVKSELVRDVRYELTREQMNRSRWMYIYFDNEEGGAMLGALLERSMSRRYIGCYRETNCMQLLLINTGDEEAKRFAAFISERMRVEYGKSAEQIQIKIENLG